MQAPEARRAAWLVPCKRFGFGLTRSLRTRLSLEPEPPPNRLGLTAASDFLVLLPAPHPGIPRLVLGAAGGSGTLAGLFHGPRGGERSGGREVGGEGKSRNAARGFGFRV